MGEGKIKKVQGSISKELGGIAAGGTFNLAGKVISSGIVFIYTVIVVRVLGAERFGLYTLGMTLFTFIGILCRLGLDSGVVRLVSLYHGINDAKRVKGTAISALLIVLVISSLMIPIVFLFSKPFIDTLFHKSELFGVVKYFSISLPFWSVMHIALGFTLGLKKMKYFVCGHYFLLPISNLIFVVIFLYMGLGLYGVVFAHILAVGLVSIVSLFFVKTCLAEEEKSEKDKFEYMGGELLRVSLPLSLTFFLNFLSNWTDTLMIGFFKLPRDVGIYNGAMKVALMTCLIMTSFNSIFAPFISDLHNRGEIEKLEKLFKIITRWIFTAGLGAFLFILLQSKQILLLFGAGFDEGVPCLIILSCVQLLNAGVGSVSLILAMTGREKLLMGTVLFFCAVNICLNYILIPLKGITGAALATGTSTLLLNLLMLFQVYYIHGMHPYEIRFLKILVSGGGAFVFMLIFNYMLPVFSLKTGLFGQIPVFLSVYTGMLLTWGIDDEDKFLFDLLRQKLKKRRIPSL